MSDLKVTKATTKTSMADLRPALDAALAEEFPGGMMKSRWEDDALILSGPGADGRIVFQDGQLLGEATLRPPASLMKPVIEKKIAAVFDKACR